MKDLNSKDLPAGNVKQTDIGVEKKLNAKVQNSFAVPGIAR